jgi:anaerobic selenocysteine-containing dehydrogenase
LRLRAYTPGVLPAVKVALAAGLLVPPKARLPDPLKAPSMALKPLKFREPPESPVSTPQLYEEYPYILITGARQPGFFHTENRQVPWLRELHPDPMIELHPDTAAKEGIQEGDWVIIESLRGKVRQRAKFFAGMDPRVVAAQHAWWFPEKKDPGHGWDESNINILTDNAYVTMDPAMGASSIRTLLVKIYPEKKLE